MIFLQLGKCLYRGFLKHLLEHIRCTTATDKHTMVFGHRGVEPETITDNIGLRDGLQGLCGPDKHITTDNHRMDIIGCHCHHLLVQRQLHTQQVL